MFTQIVVRGQDAAGFLQSQLTQDIGRASAAASPFAAWCNARGRVIALFRLVTLADGYGLVLPASLATTVRERLLMYRLRAKLTVDVADGDWRGQAVDVAANEPQLAGHPLLPGPEPGATTRHDGIIAVRLSGACIELYGTERALAAATAGVDMLDDGRWRAARIEAGIADIEAATSEQYTPHMLNLDRLGALSFSKGCYPGQEVVARTQHLGNSRRRLQRFTASAAVHTGDKLRHADRDAGVVVASAGRDFLGLLPTDLHDAAVEVGGQRAEPVRDGAAPQLV